MKKLSIVIISDTHGKHKYLNNLPKADVIIHCGDFTSVGYEHEIRNFMKWYSNLNQYAHKICCAGNHDRLFEGNERLAKSLVPKNISYLEDSGIEIKNINFYGTPVSKPFYNWAFMRPEERLIEYWRAIPDNTDVLITHSPPYSIFDYVERDNKHEGSPSLYAEVTSRIKPLLHLMGHIHSGYGFKIIENTTFINASNLDEDYMCVNKPFLVELTNGVIKIIDY